MEKRIKTEVSARSYLFTQHQRFYTVISGNKLTTTFASEAILLVIGRHNFTSMVCKNKLGYKCKSNTLLNHLSQPVIYARLFAVQEARFGDENTDPNSGERRRGRKRRSLTEIGPKTHLQGGQTAGNIFFETDL